MPLGFTRLARTAKEAIAFLSTGKVDFISLDHDLGSDFEEGVATGYDVACYIEEQVLAGKIPRPGWTVHSSNPVGVERIKAALSNLEVSKCQEKKRY